MPVASQARAKFTAVEPQVLGVPHEVSHRICLHGPHDLVQEEAVVILPVPILIPRAASGPRGQEGVRVRPLEGEVVEDEPDPAGLDVGDVEDRLGLPEEVLARRALVVPEFHEGHRGVGVA